MSELEQKQISQRAIKLFDEIWEQSTNDFNRNYEAMNQLFSLLGGVVFEKVHEDELDGAKFLIEISPTKTKKFITGRIPDNKTVEKPVFGMTIKISDNFQRKDMPGFNAAIATAHNNWLKQQGFKIDINRVFFIDENKNLARFWNFFAQKLEDLLLDNPVMNNLVAAQINTFSQVFRLLANQYQSHKIEDMTENKTSDLHLQALWDLELKNKIQKIIDKTAKKQKTRVLKKSKLRNEEELVETDQAVFLPLALEKISGRVIKNIKNRLDTQQRQALFRASEKELLRKSGLSDIVKDNVGKSLLEILVNPWHTTLDTLGFSEQKKYLEHKQTIYASLKKQITAEKDPVKKAKIKKKLAQLQFNIARKINHIVFSEVFWKYEKDSFSFEHLLRNEVDCLAIVHLLYSIWNEFFGEKPLVVRLSGHFSSMLHLADGSWASLDGIVKEVKDVEQWLKQKYAHMGLHEDFYQAGVLNQQQGLLSKSTDNRDLALAEDLIRESIRLNPKTPYLKYNLAFFLAEQGADRWKEAEKLYRECIRFNPKDTSFKFKLASLLRKYGPDRWKESEELYREAISLKPNEPDYKNNLGLLLAEYGSEKWKEVESLYMDAYKLDKKNPWRSSALAFFYDEVVSSEMFPQRIAKSKKFYQKSLDLMEKYPSKPNWLTKEEIEARLIKL